MQTLRRGIVVVAVVLVVLPALSLAGIMDRGCCRKCRLVRPRCCCPVFVPMETAPVCPAPAPQVTMKTVVETQYRMERVTENVPVTRMEAVTVDEGGYQQVWVPKIVCKQVPKTVMQQRTACRPVAVQVPRQVPELVCPPGGSVAPSMLMPSGGVQNGIPGSGPLLPPANPVDSTGYPTSSTTGGYQGATIAVPMAPIATPTSATSHPGYGSPTPAVTPKLAPTPVGSLDQGLLPQADQGSSAGEVRSIQRRSANSTHRREPTPAGHSGQPNSSQMDRKVPQGAFQPAPSAAMVWRVQQGTSVR